MHHISQIKIQNFKSIKDSEFALSGYTPLVGYNNAGKSNLLDAILWVVSKSALKEADFFDPNSPVVIEATITGITEDVLATLGNTHAGKIRPYLHDSSIKIRRSQTSPNVAVSAISLEIENNDNGAITWDANPAGIDNAVKNMLPEPIIIKAMENAAEDVAKFGTGTTIGKLLKAIIQPIHDQHNQEIQTALQTVADTLSANGQNREPALIELDDKIEASLKEFFPGITAKAHIPIPEFNDFMKSATIKLSEEGPHSATWRDANSLGHGAQRSIQIALIKCLSLMNKEAKGHEARTTILLIDEPELYLHPQAIETVKSALKQLSANGYQIIFTTHSANMIDRDDAPNTALIRKHETDGTFCFPRLSHIVETTIADAPTQAEILFSLTNSTQILFSEKVILAEGRTEQRILPDLYHGITGSSLGQNKLGLVSLGGSGNIIKTLQVLAAMGLPSKAIVDLDFCCKIAAGTTILDDNNPDLLAFRTGIANSSQTHGFQTDQSGMPTKCANFSAAEGFALTASDGHVSQNINNLHTHLKAQGIWMWTSGTIEVPLLLAGKSISHHSAFLTSFKATQNKTTLPYYGELGDLFTWLDA